MPVMDVGDPNWSICLCGALDCGSDNQVSDEKSEVLIQNCELGQEEQNSTDLFCELSTPTCLIFSLIKRLNIHYKHSLVLS